MQTERYRGGKEERAAYSDRGTELATLLFAVATSSIEIHPHEYTVNTLDRDRERVPYRSVASRLKCYQVYQLIDTNANVCRTSVSLNGIIDPTDFVKRNKTTTIGLASIPSKIDSRVSSLMRLSIPSHAA